MYWVYKYFAWLEKMLTIVNTGKIEFLLKKGQTKCIMIQRDEHWQPFFFVFFKHVLSTDFNDILLNSEEILDTRRLRSERYLKSHKLISHNMHEEDPIVGNGMLL